LNAAPGVLQDGAQYHVKEDAEFVIVGSGAAGATMARWLTAAGRSVVVVEEGAPAKAATGDGLAALQSLYRDAGMTAARGPDPLLLLQGRTVGGSSFVSGSVHVALPEQVWQTWATRDPLFQERLPWQKLEAARGRIDQELAVQKTPRSLLGDDADALLRALPGQAMPTWRGAPACIGSGRCFQGCPSAGKASVNLTLLPFAVQKGARIYSRCQVAAIVFKGKRAVGVRGQFDNGYRFTARASVAVIVTAGAIETPALLLRSGVSGVSGVGDNWTCHPTVMVSGLWNKTLGLRGATQGVDLPGSQLPGVDIETVRLPEAWRRLTLPGWGNALAERLEQLPQVVTWQVRLRPEAIGRVRLGRLSRRPQVDFALAPADRRALAQGVGQAAEGMLRAGALTVWPQVRGWPEEIASLKQVHDVGSRQIQPGALALTATQLFGGVRTDARGVVAGCERLIVADASALPGAPGVPPLSLIHAAATVLAEYWVDART
jgi:choline dehydrogenase-like flavoprotein